MGRRDYILGQFGKPRDAAASRSRDLYGRDPYIFEA